MAALPARPRTAALGVVLAFAGLATTAPTPSRARRELFAPTADGDPTAPVVAAVSLLAWLLAAWLLATVVLALAAHLPGTGGRAASLAVRGVAPLAVRRAVEVALGLTVATGALGATAAAASSGSGLPAPPVAAVSTPPAEPDGGTPPVDLDWPATGEPPAAQPQPAATPTDVAVVRVGEAAPPVHDAVPDAVRGAPLPSGTGVEQVVVQRGDTLWDLAESALARQSGHDPSNAQVAAAWPQWWAANRAAVGADPDLLLPGTTLRPPDR